ncbi:hypothetical protein QRX50_19040 [Amycolatopsis carbonis]|uniref:Uncharacterized protein n=1 Tax=Amycolatopsis carbonis TaxID=715471 RepID=A0A9Y2MXU8_9PSEU|nr:hypothetical protein [Amycolatopsis sp. 2-15]WIX82721.1 hypothetical protein QRX50_19040 [Amycolatopsis sp. 2-15]
MPSVVSGSGPKTVTATSVSDRRGRAATGELDVTTNPSSGAVLPPKILSDFAGNRFRKSSVT